MSETIISLLQSNKKEDIIASMFLLNDLHVNGGVSEREIQHVAPQVLNRLGGTCCFGQLFTLSTFPKVQHESLKFFINCCQFCLLASIDKPLLQLLIQVLLTTNDQSLTELLIISIKSTLKLNITHYEVVYKLLAHPALLTSPNPSSSLSLTRDLLAQSQSSLDTAAITLTTNEAVALQTIIIQSLHGAAQEYSRDLSLDHLCNLLTIPPTTLHPAWTIAANGSSSSFPVFVLSSMTVELRLSCEELLEIIKYTLPAPDNDSDNGATTTVQVLETRLHRISSVLPDCMNIVSSCLQLLLDDSDSEEAVFLWQSLPAQDLLSINRSLRDIISTFLDVAHSFSLLQLQLSPSTLSSVLSMTALCTANTTLTSVIIIIDKLILEDFEVCKQVLDSDSFASLWRCVVWFSGHNTEIAKSNVITTLEAMIKLTLTLVEAVKDDETIAMMPKELQLSVLISERLVDCFEFIMQVVDFCFITINTHHNLFKAMLLPILINALTTAIYVFNLRKDDLQVLSRGEGQVGAIQSVFGVAAMQACAKMIELPPSSRDDDEEERELEAEVHVLGMQLAHAIQELQDIHIQQSSRTT